MRYRHYFGAKIDKLLDKYTEVWNSMKVTSNHVFICQGCGEVDPKLTDEYNESLIHLSYYEHMDNSGELVQEYDICGVLELDLFGTFKKMVEMEQKWNQLTKNQLKNEQL